MRHQIDLNSDVEESFGRYKIGLDEEVIPLISSANIACGFHAGGSAGDGQNRLHGGGVRRGPWRPSGPAGPHGFRQEDHGCEPRRNRALRDLPGGGTSGLCQRKGVLPSACETPRGPLQHGRGKPDISDTMARVISRLDENLILVALAGVNGDELASIAQKHSIRIAFEFFADRAYNPDGSLVSRKLPGAVLHDDETVAERIVKLVREGCVTAIDGTDMELEADTICVHGDNPRALSLVKKIGDSLMDSGISVSPVGTFL